MEAQPELMGTARIGKFLVAWHLLGEWAITLVLAPFDGQTGLCELHVAPKGRNFRPAKWAREVLAQYAGLEHADVPDQPLSVVGFRAMPLGSMAAASWEHHRRLVESPGPKAEESVMGAPGSWSWDFSTMSGDETRALTVARYVELLGRGHARPLQQLSEDFGVSVSAIRARLSQAREVGYLTEARKGVAGGELTEVGRAHMPLLVRLEGEHGKRSETTERNVARTVPRSRR